MSYNARAPVYNTDNGEKPPPSIEDERSSPETFYKLAAFDLESDSESDSEVEQEYEDYSQPYYDYRYEEVYPARSPSPEPVYWQSSYISYEDGHRPRASYGREEYRRPTVPHPVSTEGYRARKRAERAERAAYDDEPRHYCDTRRVPFPETEMNCWPRVPDSPRDQYHSHGSRSPSPPPTQIRYQREPFSYVSSSRTRAERLSEMEEERENREMIRENLRARRELRQEELTRRHEDSLRRAAEETERSRLQREEEEHLRNRLRQRQNGPGKISIPYRK